MAIDQFELGRRVRNQQYGEGEILGKCKHENSWDVQFDNFPFWLCAHESNLELLPIDPKQADGSMTETLTPTPATFKWGQLVIVDGGTDNARQGIVICDQPSQTDRSWFVSTPPCCNQWIRADRLTAVEAGKVEAEKPAAGVATQEQGGTPTAHGYEGYGWIKVKKFDPEKYATIEERYTALDMHHVQETSFLIDKVRELAAQIVDNSPYLGGQTVPLDEHQAATELLEVRKYELDYFAETVSNFRVRCHRLSEEAKEAASHAHSSPDHTESTLKTLAFRLDCLARGVMGEDK